MIEYMLVEAVFDYHLTGELEMILGVPTERAVCSRECYFTRGTRNDHSYMRIATSQYLIDDMDGIIGFRLEIEAFVSRMW